MLLLFTELYILAVPNALKGYYLENILTVPVYCIPRRNVHFSSTSRNSLWCQVPPFGAAHSEKNKDTSPMHISRHSRSAC
ncbi:MAG: hypothetical protein [Inoviridae sp.]|nr:MAG: hypothetical protein [Inoviridae sp.]